MTKLLLSFVLLVITTYVTAQVPQGINYQAVIRTANGDIMGNQDISLRISILEGSISGIVAFQESHTLSTNDFGLANLIIGQGNNLIGTLATLNWSSGVFFVKMELDSNGGSNFVELGTSQILTVPYSFYSQEAGRLKGGSSAKTLIYTEGF
jgi:hypothetical protein